MERAGLRRGLGPRDRLTWLNAVAAGGLTVGFGLALAGILVMVREPMPPDSE